MTGSHQRRDDAHEEVRMLAVTKKAAWLAVAVLVLYGGTARAAEVEVKVPFPFMVHNQVLPAGTYLVERESADTLLIRGEKGARAGAFSLTIPASGHNPAGNQPSLEFTRGESEYVLSNVWESGHDGQTIIARTR
jgi:alkylation response protein AidB-like acyl-CoA dehydrogenase